MRGKKKDRRRPCRARNVRCTGASTSPTNTCYSSGTLSRLGSWGFKGKGFAKGHNKGEDVALVVHRPNLSPHATLPTDQTPTQSNPGSLHRRRRRHRFVPCFVLSLLVFLIQGCLDVRVAAAFRRPSEVLAFRDKPSTQVPRRCDGGDPPRLARQTCIAGECASSVRQGRQASRQAGRQAGIRNFLAFSVSTNADHQIQLPAVPEPLLNALIHW